MTDKELLELAAKAAEIELREVDGFLVLDNDVIWNPLELDRDALRLAVRLKIELSYQAPDYRPDWTIVSRTRCSNHYASETGTDPYAATRRAIVRAAAEIGKGMK